MRNNGSVHIIIKYLCYTVAVIWGALIEVTKEMALECWALIGHLSEWQFNWLSNTKLYYKRTEGLPTDGKGGRKGAKYVFAPRCNHLGKRKRGRTRECLQLYAPLIERWKWLPLEREVRLTRVRMSNYAARQPQKIVWKTYYSIDINNIMPWHSVWF